MPRGTQLKDLRKMLRAEIGQTMDTLAATAEDLRLNQLLTNNQQMLASTYDWPFLEHRWDVGIPMGTRFAALPAVDENGDAVNLNIERPVKVEVLYNNDYQPVDYGIGAIEYNTRKSTGQVPELQDPIQRWRLADDIPVDTGLQFEVWPIPASAQTVRFTGQRVTGTFEADTDTCDIDGVLLVYMVAADLCAKAESPDAPFKAKRALERLNQIRQSYPVREDKLVLGQGRHMSRQARRVVPIVLVH